MRGACSEHPGWEDNEALTNIRFGRFALQLLGSTESNATENRNFDTEGSFQTDFQWQLAHKNSGKSSGKPKQFKFRIRSPMWLPIVEKLRGPAESFIVVYVLDSFVEPCFILRSLHQVHRGLYKVVCFCLGGLGGGTFGKCRCMEVSTSCEHSGCIFIAVAWGSCACAAGYGRAIVDGMAEKGKGGKCHAAPSLCMGVPLKNSSAHSIS